MITASLPFFTFVPHWVSYLFATIVMVRVAEGSNDTTCLLRPQPQRRSLGCLVLEAVAVLPKGSLLEGDDQEVSLEVVLQRRQVVPTSVPGEPQGSLLRGSQHPGGSLVLQKRLWNEADYIRS